MASSSDVYVAFGGDSSELEAALAVAKASVSSLTRELASMAREMIATGASADSELGDKMREVAARMTEAKAAASDANEEIKKGGEGAKEAGEAGALGLGALGESLKSIAELAGIGFGAEKIKEWAESTVEAAEQVSKESHKLGISLGEVQQLQGILGSGYAETSQAIELFQLSLAKSGDSSNRVTVALKALGVSAAELKLQTPTEQLKTLAEAFSQFQDGPQKTAAAIALFRGAGADLIPFLDKGKEGIHELQEMFERAGGAISDSTVHAFVETAEAIKELGLAMSSVSQDAFAQVNSAARGFVRTLADMVEAIHQSATEGGFFAGAFEAVGWAARQTAQAFAETIWILRQLNAAGEDTSLKLQEDFRFFFNYLRDETDILDKAIVNFFKNIGQVGSDVAEGLVKEFSLFGQSLAKLFTGDFAGARALNDLQGAAGAALNEKLGKDLSVSFDSSQVEAEYSRHLERLKGLDQKYWSEKAAIDRDGQAEYDTIWDIKHGKPGEHEAGEKPQVPGLNFNGGDNSGDAAQLVRAAYDQEVEPAKEAAQETETTLNGLLQRHAITMTQWLQQSLAALDKEQDAIQDAADKAMSSANLTAAQKLELANREERELAQIAQKIAQDQNKAAEETVKNWQAAFNQINSAFDSQINGLLRGTTSWGQAVKNVLASLTEDVIKFAVNWALKQAETVAMNIAGVNAEASAHIAANAAKTASDAGASAAGGLAWIGNALKAITADAAQAFGGVFAFMAPILGPAAAGPAAAASASVMAAGASVASADIGMWSVPQDMLTLVHHNELIATPDQANSIRSMPAMLSALMGALGGGGGGNSYTHNGDIVSNASDARAVAREVASIWTRTPSMRPAY